MIAQSVNHVSLDMLSAPTVWAGKLLPFNERLSRASVRADAVRPYRGISETAARSQKRRKARMILCALQRKKGKYGGWC